MTGDSGRDALLNRLDESTNEILDELRYLRTEMAERPVRSEQTSKRRMAIFLIAVSVFIAFQSYDLNIAQCSPGAKARAGIDYVATTPPGEFKNKELRRLLNAPVSESCDYSFPVAAHENSDDWPTYGNVMGGMFYLLIFVMMFLWARWPRWADKIRHIEPPPDPPRPLRHNEK